MNGLGRQNRVNQRSAACLIGIVLMMISVLAPSVTAAPSAPDPNALKNQANTNIQVASKLMAQAASLLTGTPTRYAFKTALDLYVQAGQSAEQAARIYEALGPQYASPADVENSKMMVQHCLDTIQQIKQRM